APLDRRLDVCLLQVGRDPGDHLVQIHVAAGGTIGDQSDDLLVFLGCRIANARSSSSHLMVAIPSLWARGAITSRVSRAFLTCFSGGRKRMVRMLCSRSATLITSTRGSCAIAMIILRIVSASAASPNSTLSSLVTPSTR